MVWAPGLLLPLSVFLEVAVSMKSSITLPCAIINTALVCLRLGSSFSRATFSPLAVWAPGLPLPLSVFLEVAVSMKSSIALSCAIVDATLVCLGLGPSSPRTTSLPPAVRALVLLASSWVAVSMPLALRTFSVVIFRALFGGEVQLSRMGLGRASPSETFSGCLWGLEACSTEESSAGMGNVDKVRLLCNAATASTAPSFSAFSLTSLPLSFPSSNALFDCISLDISICSREQFV